MAPSVVSGCLFPITAFGYNSLKVQQSLTVQQSLAYDVGMHILENLTVPKTGHLWKTDKSHHESGQNVAKAP